MQISGNFSVTGPDAARGISQKNSLPQSQPDASLDRASSVDQLELSDEALAISQNESAGEVFRADKVAQLRQAIASGNYDTDDKMAKALNNFLDQLG